MPFPLLLAGLTAASSLFGGLSNRSQKNESSFNNTSTNTSNYNTSGNVRGYQNFNLSPLQQAISGTVGSTLLNNLYKDQDVTKLAAPGLQTINQGADIQRKVAENILASRGQSFSPTAAPVISNIESNRIAQGNTFLNELPQLQRQQQLENLSGLMQFFNSLPTNSTSGQDTYTSGSSSETSTQKGTGTNIQPGNVAGGAVGGGLLGLLEGLRLMKGQ